MGGGGLIFGGDYKGRGLFSEFYGSLNEEITEKETGRERKLLPLVNRGLRQDIKTTRVIHFQKLLRFRPFLVRPGFQVRPRANPEHTRQ